MGHSWKPRRSCRNTLRPRKSKMEVETCIPRGAAKGRVFLFPECCSVPQSRDMCSISPGLGGSGSVLGASGCCLPSAGKKETGPVHQNPCSSSAPDTAWKDSLVRTKPMDTGVWASGGEGNTQASLAYVRLIAVTSHDPVLHTLNSL
jgi:hypothetical protein